MISPLESWLSERTGLHPLSATGLRQWQMARLAKVVDWCLEHSPFYQRRLPARKDLPQAFTPVSFACLPFVTVRDLRENGLDFLCISQDQVERVVTLATSGTTGSPKRVFFTSEDIESTLEFFQVGMSTIVGPGDAVVITLPGRTPGGAAELLSRALPALGVRAVLTDEPFDPAGVARLVDREKARCLLCQPSQLRVLMEDRQGALALFTHVKRVMLTGEPVDMKLKRRAKRLKMELFDHYGLTETCLGGGVECLAHDGYHLREADLYFEIVDPQSGLPVPLGEPGEVVVSTLSRFGMPLVRYRTGDYSRLLPGPCRCGSPLARLSPPDGRIERGPGGFRVVSPQKGSARQQ